MPVTIAALNVPNWQRDGDVVLRIYALNSFTAPDGTEIIAGNTSEDVSVNNNWFLNTPCTVAAGSLSIPSITLPSTTDSVDNPHAAWSAQLYTASGDYIGPFGQFSRFVLTPIPASITWGAIAAYVGTAAGGAAAPSFFWAGSWDASKHYALSNIVSNGNTAWIALAPSVGETPGSGASWAQMVTGAAGGAGPQGSVGPAGPPGPVGSVNGVKISPSQISSVFNSGYTSGLTAPQTEIRQSDRTLNVSGPSWSKGNQGGWGVSHMDFETGNFASRGINQMRGTVMNKRAVGDSALFYGYNYHDVGVTAPSDEGDSGHNIQLYENGPYFKGTVTSTSGTGDKAPVLALTSGNNWVSDGAMLLNISKGTLAGSLNGASASFGSTFLNQLPVTGVTLPLTAAWGTITSPDGATPVITNPGNTADINTTTATLTVTLGQIAGVRHAFTSGVVTIAGLWMPEQALLTAGAVSGDGLTQQITLAVRNPNLSVVLFQGGVAGQYLSFDANNTLTSGRVRSSYYAFGSLTGTDLIYGFNVQGTLQGKGIPNPGHEAAATSGAGSGFHLYPGAEVVKSNGFQPTLEPNNVSFAAGDIIEVPHNPSAGGSGLTVTKIQDTPTNLAFGGQGIAVGLLGAGIAGSKFTALLLTNINPFSYYKSGGGPLDAPTGIRLNGQFGAPIEIDFAPDSTQALIEIGNLANYQNPGSYSTPINLFGFKSCLGGAFSFTPSTQQWYANNLGARTLTINTSVNAGSVLTSFLYGAGGGNYGMNAGLYCDPGYLRLYGYNASQATALYIAGWNAGQRSEIAFCDGTNPKWAIGKDNDNSFRINDIANRDVLEAVVGGGLYLMPQAGSVSVGVNKSTAQAGLLNVGSVFNVNAAGDTTAKSVIMADTTNGHTYKLTMVNGVLTTTQIS